MERKTGVYRGRKRTSQTVLQYSSRGPDRPADLWLHVERVTGIEPAWPAWKAGALPLSYTREVPAQPNGPVWPLVRQAPSRAGHQHDADVLGDLPCRRGVLDGLIDPPPGQQFRQGRPGAGVRAGIRAAWLPLSPRAGAPPRLGPARCPRGRSGTASTPCSPPEFGQRARELQAAYARYDGAGPGGGVDPGGGRVGSSVG
jgi:hypothetical protein